MAAPEAADGAAVQLTADGKYQAQEYRKWLISRMDEWASTEGISESYNQACMATFGKVPSAQQMSLDEMEQVLTGLGDEEVANMKAHTEDMFDGQFKRYMTDAQGQPFAGFIVADVFGETQVYCHQTHLRHLQPGDSVRFAVHYNAKGQPQCSFVDRLNNRAAEGKRTGPPPMTPPAQVKGGKGKGKGKGMAPVAPAPAWQPVQPMAASGYRAPPQVAPGPGGLQGPVTVTLPDGTVIQGNVIGGPQGGAAPSVQPMGMQQPFPGPPRMKGGKGAPKGKGKGAAPYAAAGAEQGQRPGKPPDPTKKIYTGRVARQVGPSGFVECEEALAEFGKDVYMWKSYFSLAGVDDIINFQLHVSDKGLPQVCWLERVSGPEGPGGFAPGPVAGQKRPAAPMMGAAVRPRLGGPELVNAQPSFPPQPA